jgi:regulator of nucleoside diphosphate kinase
MSQRIILTTGIYDLIKDHVRRKRVTLQEEEILLKELKTASQVLRRDLPKEVVTVNKLVTYKDHQTNENRTVTFVGPTRAKQSKNKISILSDEGIAIVGHKEGDIIEWPARKGDLKLEIVKVDDLA